jgi:Protein of unknown function (DUF1592)/Protein of unknown function (DUF1588)
MVMMTRFVLTISAIACTILFYQNCARHDMKSSVSSSQSNSLFGSTGSGPTLVRRLSNLEYRNSLADVLAYQFSRQNSGLGATIFNRVEATNILSTLPTDASPLRLGTDQLASLNMSADRFSAYLSIANAVSREITSQSSTLQAFAGSCATSNTSISNTNCLNSFINNFGLIVFRTPPKPAEVDELKRGITSWFDLIGRFLIHPRFLSHYEREGTLRNGMYQLTAYELSARLASVFWKSVPDLTGLSAAASGAILTKSGLRSEINRLLASPKAHEALWMFYQQWFAVSRLPTTYDTGAAAQASANPIAVTTLNTQAFRQAVLDDGREFLEYFTWRTAGTLDDIFRSSLLFTTNSTLASIYGVSPRANSTAAPVNDGTGRYSGILTRALITHQKPSHDGNPNHILRGVFLLSNLMGTQLGLPSNFAEQQALVNEVPRNASSRTEVTILTSPRQCMICHTSINPSGFAMANFDWLGRYMTTERRFKLDPNTNQVTQVASNPVDASTTLNLNGINYSISGVPSLVRAMSESGKLYEGFSQYYFRFAFGRMDDETEDRGLVQQLGQNLKTQSIREALTNMALHEDFAKAQGAR